MSGNCTDLYATVTVQADSIALAPDRFWPGEFVDETRSDKKMKRMTLFAGALVLLLVAGMVGAVSANEIPAYAVEYPLYAGQTELVGAVFVWNDEADLHVFYDLDEGWCMTESHLEVADSLEGIPQTKKGNPIPGQFTYGETYPSCVGSDEFVIPLSDLGEQLIIAAHARVWASTGADKTVTECFSSEAGINAYGPLLSYAAIDDPAWVPIEGGAVTAWIHASWPALDGATWISTAEYVEAPYGDDSWRRFSGAFDINDGFPLSGTVTANADNAEEFYINGDLVYTDGEVQGTYSDDHEWGTIVSNDFTPIAGTNTYDFIVRNYPGTNTQEGNPTALIYEICYTYSIASETAWGAQNEPLTTQFDGKNWATYFTYDVQGWQNLETLFVPADDPNGVSSTEILNDGMLYRLEANGTYFFRTEFSSSGYLADAEWALRHDTYGEGWVKGSIPPYTNIQGLDLTVDDPYSDIDWGDFNEEHIYSVEYTGMGATVPFAIYDSCYTDNSGALKVDIYQWM